MGEDEIGDMVDFQSAVEPHAAPHRHAHATRGVGYQW